MFRITAAVALASVPVAAQNLVTSMIQFTPRVGEPQQVLENDQEGRNEDLFCSRRTACPTHSRDDSRRLVPKFTVTTANSLARAWRDLPIRLR
jgi:hypothetical protein